MAMRYGKLKVFSLSANVPLAEEIAKEVGVELSKCEVKHFADGEVMVDIKETVRGCEVYVIQPTCAPNVNEHLMELLIMVDALKRASAHTINLVIPYYGYSRQDRKAKAREPITSRLVADLIQAAGATRVMTMDLHAAQIQGFFNIPIDDFRGLPIISNHFVQSGLNMDEVVVVSPDHGGATRARKLADHLNTPIAIIDKRRPKANVAEVMGIVGEVKGKRCIIIDDMIDTAGSITKAAEALMDNGAIEVYAACTHPILSGPAIERLSNSVIKELVVTNTIPLPEEKRIDKITQLNVGPLLGQAIKRVYNDEPVSKLFEIYEVK
jgi:ribose-phosphate pyrophosphokinase